MWNGNAIPNDVPYTLNYDLELIDGLQLLFAPNQAERTFKVIILDDDIPESQERFAVFIRQIDRVDVKPHVIVLVVIEDDDVTSGSLRRKHALIIRSFQIHLARSHLFYHAEESFIFPICLNLKAYFKMYWTNTTHVCIFFECIPRVDSKYCHQIW